MLPMIPLIGGFLASIAPFILKHPFVSKMMIFSVFTAVLYASFTYLKSLVFPHLASNGLFSLAAYFGLFDGLSVYLTILVSGFGVKQILAFIRS